MKKIAVFASGSGTNAQRITEYFRQRGTASVELILCNNPDAYVIKRAEKLNVPVYVFTRDQFYGSQAVLEKLMEKNVEMLVLAGFLWLLPTYLLEAYRQRIINIHPALLPDYGGKGMYGMKVHEAVINAGDTESGISIHFVDEIYDHGQIIFQATCPVNPEDTPETLAQKIHELEYRYFPLIIEKELLK